MGDVSLYASDINGCGYGSLVYSHCLEVVRWGVRESGRVGYL